MLFYVQMRWNYQGRISQDQLWDLEALEGAHGVEGIRAGFVQLYKVVSQGGASIGKSPLMAPWGGVVNDEGIRDLIAYIRKLSGT